MIDRWLGTDKQMGAVENTRGGISKKSMIHNDATPDIQIDPETYAVVADGELLVCEPAKELPLEVTEPELCLRTSSRAVCPNLRSRISVTLC